jgi:hypothetical protein
MIFDSLNLIFILCFFIIIFIILLPYLRIDKKIKRLKKILENINDTKKNHMER